MEIKNIVWIESEPSSDRPDEKVHYAQCGDVTIAHVINYNGMWHGCLNQFPGTIIGSYPSLSFVKSLCEQAFSSKISSNYDLIQKIKS